MTLQQANEIVLSYQADYTPKSTVEPVFQTLSCALKDLQYVAVVGTAGKTCVATLEASILCAAGFSQTGCYSGGAAALRERITVGGKLVPAKVYAAAVAQVHSHIDASFSAAAAEFLIACLCFAKSNCAFAVVELPEPEYAALFYRMPACAIVQLGQNAAGHSTAREAKAACRVLRTGTTVITSPVQPEEALAELTAQAKEIGCLLTVPDLEDFTEIKHRHLQNRMDYGGYQVILPYLGEYATYNAAIAIELALALWRKGVDISDEAILEGLSLAENTASLLPLKYRPMVLVNACQSPLQAAAFSNWVKQEEYQAISLVVGFARNSNVDAIFAALETGAVVDFDNPEKEQMPGMTENAIDKVYAVPLEGAEGYSASELVAIGKFHFDIVPCDSFAQALQMAQADANEGVVICGSPALIEQAKKAIK